MKLFRSGKTSRTWAATDTRPIAVEEWQPDKILEVDGTIDKEGTRHTSFGLRIEAADIAALSGALARHHEVMRQGLEEINSLITQRSYSSDAQEKLLNAIETITKKCLSAS